MKFMLHQWEFLKLQWNLIEKQFIYNTLCNDQLLQVYGRFSFIS